MKNKCICISSYMVLCFIFLSHHLNSLTIDSSNSTQIKKEIKLFTDKYFDSNNFTKIFNFDHNYTNIIIKIDNTLNSELKLFCKNHCSFRGYCLDGKCYCKPLYTGDDCSKLNHPVSCSEGNCSNNGVCNDEGICICKEGFDGYDCSISKYFVFNTK